MSERELGGMQQQPLSWFAVETVAYNRRTKPFGMCAMDAQLMCAACVRCQCYASKSALMAQHLVVGQRRFAVFIVHHLSRAVVHV